MMETTMSSNASNTIIGLSNAIVGAANSRFFAPGTLDWLYPPKQTLTNGSFIDTWYLDNGTTVTGPTIDCSNFVYQVMLSAGYKVDNTSAQDSSSSFIDIVNGTQLSLSYTKVSSFSDVQPGDVIVFDSGNDQHVGIVQSYDPSTGIGTFMGSQSSTGADYNVKFTTNPNTTVDKSDNSFIYWGNGNEPFEVSGFARVNQSTYNQQEASTDLDKINNSINNSLVGFGLNSYFSSSETTSGDAASVPADPNDPGSDLPWSQTTVDVNNDKTWTSLTSYYDSNSNLTEQETNNNGTSTAKWFSYDINGNPVSTDTKGYSGTKLTGIENFEEDDTIGQNGNVTSANISGQGDVANLNNANVTLKAGSTSTVNGNGNVYSGGIGSKVTDNLSNGTSIVENFGPSSAVASEIQTYSSPNSSGNVLQLLFHFLLKIIF